MGKIIYLDPVDEIRGRLVKDGAIHRCKVYRDENGVIRGTAAKETYYMKNPRDWNKIPPKEKELAHQLNFQQACNETKEILKSSKPDYAATEEEIARLRYWKERFQAQLKKGEKEAPVDPKTQQHKIYLRLDNFIRACILRQLTDN